MAACASEELEEPILTGFLTKQGKPRFRLLHKLESYSVIVDANFSVCGPCLLKSVT